MHPIRPLALITGARRGIGAAIAIELAGRGFDLALTDIDIEGAESTMARIQALGAQASLHRSDLREVKAHPALVEHIVATQGPISCLVNNAGVPAAQRADLLDVDAASYDQRIADGLVPMGRWGYPKDVALAVASLASGQLGFSTGSVVNVDGALSIPGF